MVETPANARLLSSRESGNIGTSNLFQPSRFTVPSIEQMIKRQIQDLRERIMEYDVIGFEKPQIADNPRVQKQIPNHADILILGPAGSGKSSLIKTFYRSLYEVKHLPPHVKGNLTIRESRPQGNEYSDKKNLKSSDGTAQFTAILLKKRTRVIAKTQPMLRSRETKIMSARETTTLETFHQPNPARKQGAGAFGLYSQTREETFSQKTTLVIKRSSNALNPIQRQVQFSQQAFQASPASGEYRPSKLKRSVSQPKELMQSLLNQDLNASQAESIMNSLLENKKKKQDSMRAKGKTVYQKTSSPKNQQERAKNNSKNNLQEEVKSKVQMQVNQQINKQQEPKDQITYSSAIIVHDTKGQISFDQRELEQVNLLLRGKAKNKAQVEQRDHRNALKLWEFWKKDQELFPERITQESKTVKRKPHSIILVFDGSQEEIPTTEQEMIFYREVLQRCRQRKYVYPQIVLTCADKIEEQMVKEFEQEERQRESEFTRITNAAVITQEQALLYESGKLEKQEESKLSNVYYQPENTHDYMSKQGTFKNSPARRASKMNLMEQEQRLRDVLDLKIERVALNLGVPRSSIHFIENYKFSGAGLDQEEDQQFRIDYKALRLLHECLLQSDSYVHTQLVLEKKNFQKCSIF